MPLISDFCFDAGLAPLDTQANRIDICSSEPTSFAQATTGGAVSLGNAVSAAFPGISAPADRTPTGRKVTVSAVSHASALVTNNGTANFWAITDTVNSRLLATGAISDPEAVVTGNPFTLAAFDIGIADAT